MLPLHVPGIPRGILRISRDKKMSEKRPKTGGSAFSDRLLAQPGPGVHGVGAVPFISALVCAQPRPR
jgi:hypothetical protein